MNINPEFRKNQVELLEIKTKKKDRNKKCIENID